MNQGTSGIGLIGEILKNGVTAQKPITAMMMAQMSNALKSGKVEEGAAKKTDCPFFLLSYAFTSFGDSLPLSNARTFSRVVCAMAARASFVKNP